MLMTPTAALVDMLTGEDYAPPAFGNSERTASTNEDSMDSPPSTVVDLRAKHRMATVVHDNLTTPASSARVSGFIG